MTFCCFTSCSITWVSHISRATLTLPFVETTRVKQKCAKIINKVVQIVLYVRFFRCFLIWFQYEHMNERRTNQKYIFYDSFIDIFQVCRTNRVVGMYVSRRVCVKPPTLKAPISFIHICEHEPGSSHSLISSHLVLLTSLYLLGSKKKCMRVLKIRSPLGL